MPADGTIQTISIGLGLDVSRLEADANEAKRTLERVLPARQERFLTLKPRLEPNAQERIISEIDKIRGKAQTALDSKPFRLTPKFTVTTVAARATPPSRTCAVVAARARIHAPTSRASRPNA